MIYPIRELMIRLDDIIASSKRRQELATNALFDKTEDTNSIVETLERESIKQEAYNEVIELINMPIKSVSKAPANLLEDINNIIQR